MAGALPPEICLVVFDHLDSFVDLGTARLLCRHWFDSFMHCETSIVTRLIQNIFRVNPEALVVEQALLVRESMSPNVRKQFAEHHLRKLNIQMTIDRWTWRSAYCIADLHNKIERFARDFIQQAFDADAQYSELDPPPGYPVSAREMTRVMRAFYRFELYNVLWPEDLELKGFQDLRSGFCSYFSVAELNQLSCVWLYLYRALRPVHNDLADHDIEWGNFQIRRLGRQDFHLRATLSVQLLRLMMKSLRYQSDLIYAADFHSRCALIDDAGCLELSSDTKDRRCYLRQVSLQASLCWTTVSMEHYGVEEEKKLGQYSPDKYAKYIASQGPLVADPDGGPMHAWCWAYNQKTRLEFGPELGNELLFQRGYCFWDRRRLDQWPLLRDPWEEIRPSRGSTEERVELFVASMEPSWMARKKAYEKGRRGWFNETEEGCGPALPVVGGAATWLCWKLWFSFVWIWIKISRVFYWLFEG